MLCRLLSIAGLFLPGCRSAAPPATDAAGLADSARWNNRLIVLSADAASDSEFDTQRRSLLRDAPALDERHLIVIELRSDGGRFGDRTVDAEGIADLRRRWDIPTDGFHAVLVGKDGRSKRRWSTVFDPAEMHDLIDTMPMRQDEMRSRPDE